MTSRNSVGQSGENFNRMKLAFWHFGKCAGQYTVSYFGRRNGGGFKVLNSWGNGNKRDWTARERATIANGKHEEDTLFSNHHLNLTEKDLDLFSVRGWHTFTIYRDPRDIMCSLYHYGQKLIRNKKDCPGAPFHSQGVLAGHLGKGLWTPPDVTRLSLSDCLVQLVERPELSRFWDFPEYMKRLDFVLPNTEPGFKSFLSSMGLKFKPHRRVNESGNPGYLSLEPTLSRQARECLRGSRKLRAALDYYESISSQI